MDFPSGPSATRLQTGTPCCTPIGFLAGVAVVKSGQDILRGRLCGVMSISPEMEEDRDFLPFAFAAFCDTGALGGVAAIRMCLLSPSPSFSVYVNTIDFSTLRVSSKDQPYGESVLGNTRAGDGAARFWR